MLLAADKVVAIDGSVLDAPPAATTLWEKDFTLTKVGEVDDTVLEERVRMGTLIEEAAMLMKWYILCTRCVNGVANRKRLVQDYVQKHKGNAETVERVCVCVRGRGGE